MMKVFAVVGVVVAVADAGDVEAGDIGNFKTGDDVDYSTGGGDFTFGPFSSKSEACAACFGGYGRNTMAGCRCMARKRTPDADEWHQQCGNPVTVGKLYEDCWDDDPAPACEGIEWAPARATCSASTFTKNAVAKGADWQSCMKMCCHNKDCNVYQIINGECHTGYASERDCTGAYLAAGMRKVEQ
mmetsp:Transcript_17165/g.41307  ORF Transcript_17165/g.41307 Transcript_17165/m.41307 type:complete len:186 (+) Transcript_17165:90-647(+)